MVIVLWVKWADMHNTTEIYPHYGCHIEGAYFNQGCIHVSKGLCDDDDYDDDDDDSVVFYSAGVHIENMLIVPLGRKDKVCHRIRKKNKK